MTTDRDHIDHARRFMERNRVAILERRRELDEIYEKYDILNGGSDRAVEMALSPDCDTFATTPRYWDCKCKTDFIRQSTEITCARCEAEAIIQPDSRINEVIAEGLPLDLDDPATRRGLEFHSVGALLSAEAS